MTTTQNLLSLTLIIFFTFLAFYTQRPIAVSTPTDGQYSAENARKHIEIMAAEPHFIGSPANEKVRDYIVGQFKQMGLEVEIQADYLQHTWPGAASMRFAKPENIIARLKGKGSGKAVLVMGHYDSVLNSPGAGDDVHAVANILEVARLLAAEDLANDVIFLVTDGEEQALFGAQTYAANHDLSEIGVLLNYEARGNRGQSISFEWSDGNAWLVKQLRKVGRRPIANSMSYEIYNRMPNGSDFTIFKDEGVPGINNAFIGGFSYYHSPDDTPQRLNYRSVQHAGENMLRLTRHFANQDLSDVKSQNASFFNLFGLLIIYPVWLDTVLLVLSLGLWFFLLMGWIRNQQLSIGKWVLSFLSILVSIVLAVGAALGLGTLIYALYPHYKVFYAGQYYNHEWYLLALAGISTVLLWFPLSRLRAGLGLAGLQMAYVSLIQILLLIIYFMAPTATYIMAIPLLGLYLALLLSRGTKGDEGKDESVLTGLSIMLLPIGFWTVATYLIYLAFSLSLLPGPVLFCALFVMATLIAFPSWWKKESRVLPVAGLVAFLGAMLVAHLQSQPTADRPLPSDLFHFFNADEGFAYWITSDDQLNVGNEVMLKGAKEVDLEVPWSLRRLAVPSDHTDQTLAPQLEIDSTGNGAVITNVKQPYWMTVVLENPSMLSRFEMQGQVLDSLPIDREFPYYINVYGTGLEQFKLGWVKKDSSAVLDITVCTRLPDLPTPDQLPDNAVRRSGYNFVMKKLKL